MPINAPEPSIKYTDQQIQQIESYKAKELNFLNNISLLSCELENLKTRIVDNIEIKDSLEEEIKFLENNKQSTEIKVHDLQTSLDSIESKLLDKEGEHEEVSDKVKLILSDINKERQILEEENKKLEKRELEFEEKIVHFSEEKKLFDKKNKILTEAIELL